ncbi:helix-turn-helix domain-containing protein [Halobacillus campisalis]|uniref:Helix-turn-helix domain-containing protein n=2 Tax=Halobacillus campisalis TaxID=435909 RepID=A0ABW2JY26_9BACI|nr:helix-turn-helix transcriptional regulator [Halobacillus campisalis]
MKEKHIEDAAKAFGTQLRNLRLEVDLSQEELAFRTGVSPNHIGYIERAERNPKLDLINKIAFALRVQPATLFTTIEVPSDLDEHGERPTGQ